MNRRRRDWRNLEEALFKVLMVGSTVLVAGSLLAILGMIFARGLPHLSWEMISRTPDGGYYLGGSGGVLNAIVGSMCLGAGATALALCAGLPVVLCMHTYLPRGSALTRAVRLSMDMLWGVPSIVYGAFGFTLMVLLGLKASLGAAVITVALLVLPVLVRAMDEVLRTLPPEIPEASYSLGATRIETALRVVLRQSLPGLATAVLMAFGRAIGDTASVLFTAGFTDEIPTSLAQPTATLPLAIFFQLGSPLQAVQGRAYAAAAILTLLVLALSISSRLLMRICSRHSIR